MDPINTDSVQITPVETVNLPVPTLEYSGFWRRLVAGFIDGFILFILGVFAGFIFGFVSALSGVGVNSSVYTAIRSFVNILMYIVGFVYYVYFTGKTGQTLGKKAMGIKVVRLSDNLPIGYTSAFLRETVGKFISAFVIMLGYLWMVWDSKKQT